MKHHERTRIIVEMESPNGEIGNIDIEVKCWDNSNVVKLSREETLFVVSTIFNNALKHTKGSKE